MLVCMPDSDGDEEAEEGFVTLTSLLNSVPHVPHNFQPYVPSDPTNATALILCSSGTTGLPKGVELTHSNVLLGFLNPL